MKKYFVKTIVVLLISAIVPMVSGLCFNVLANPFFQVKVAQAASLDISSVIDGDMCGQEPVARQSSNSVFTSEPTFAPSPILVFNSVHSGSTTESHNTSLSCCLTGNASVVTVFQLTEIGKSIPLSFFNQKILPEDILRVTVHRALLTSPPELSSIKTTILRI